MRTSLKSFLLLYEDLRKTYGIKLILTSLTRAYILQKCIHWDTSDKDCLLIIFPLQYFQALTQAIPNHTSA